MSSAKNEGPKTADTPHADASDTAKAAPLPPNRCYWALSLEPAAAAELEKLVAATLMAVGSTSLIPKHEFHCTLLFMGRSRDKEAPLLPLNGRRSTVTVTQVCVTERLCCAQVVIDDPEVAAVCQNAYPHLTLALGPKVPAKESNDALTIVGRGEAPVEWKVLPNFPGVEHPVRLEGVVRAM
jgi:hypothetical protein